MTVAAAIACGSSTPPFLEISETPAGFGAHEASLGVLADGYAVAWYDTRDGKPEVYARTLDASGKPSGPPHRLTVGTDAAYEADITSDGERLIVGWYEKSATNTFTPKLGVWNRDGEPEWTKTLAPSGRNTVVDTYGDRIFAAWIQDDTATESSVWIGWWNTGGAPVRRPSRVAPASRTTWNLNVTLDGDGAAWLVFDAAAGTHAEELFLVRAGADGDVLVVGLTPDDGHGSKYPDVALTEGLAALTWFDERDGNQEVYLAVVSADELVAGVERRALRVTDTPGDSIGAYLDWNADRLGLAWSDDSSGQHEVFFQAFDARGDKVGDEQQVTHTPSASMIPAIRPWGDGFILAWNETDPAGVAVGHGGVSGSRIVATRVP